MKFVAGHRANEADESVLESVALSYDFFELVQQLSLSPKRTAR